MHTLAKPIALTAATVAALSIAAPTAAAREYVRCDEGDSYCVTGNAYFGGGTITVNADVFASTQGRFFLQQTGGGPAYCDTPFPGSWGPTDFQCGGLPAGNYFGVVGTAQQNARVVISLNW